QLLLRLLELALEAVDLGLHRCGRARWRCGWVWRAVAPLGFAGLPHPAIEGRILEPKVPSDLGNRPIRFVAVPYGPGNEGAGVLLRFLSHGCSLVESTESGPGQCMACHC